MGVGEMEDCKIEKCHENGMAHQTFLPFMCTKLDYILLLSFISRSFKNKKKWPKVFL